MVVCDCVGTHILNFVNQQKKLVQGRRERGWCREREVRWLRGREGGEERRWWRERVRDGEDDEVAWSMTWRVRWHNM